ncbi:MAG: hypothetical protein WAU57_00575, partial [Xanthobacteraceae bacterium]
MVDAPANVFDQFDTASLPSATAAPAGVAPQGGNIFDQFDGAPSAAPAATAASPGGTDVPGIGYMPNASPVSSAAMQRVWDNPTPGGLVSIIKGIYTGAQAGATATKMAAGGDMGDDVTDQAAAAATNLVGAGITGGALPSVTAKLAPTAADAAVQAAGRIGVLLPKFMATDGSILPAAAQGLKAIPGVGSPIYAGTAGVRQGLENAINTAATSSTPDVAGGAAKDALINNIKVDTPGAVGALYNTAEGLMTDPDARVPLTNTTAMINQLKAARINANMPPMGPAMSTL